MTAPFYNRIHSLDLFVRYHVERTALANPFSQRPQQLHRRNRSRQIVSVIPNRGGRWLGTIAFREMAIFVLLVIAILRDGVRVLGKRQNITAFGRRQQNSFVRRVTPRYARMPPAVIAD